MARHGRAGLQALRWLAAIASAAAAAAAASASAGGGGEGSSARTLSFLFVPMLSNSPAMDMMGVAAQLRTRGHAVAVVAEPQAMEFLKSAAARHSSNTTAEAIDYIPVALGLSPRESAPAAPQGGKARPRVDVLRMGRVTQGRFAAPKSRLRSVTVGADLLGSIQDVLAEPCAALLSNDAAMKRLRALSLDAVTAIGLPIGVGAARDSCGCMLAHALDVPLFDVDGGGLWMAPPSVPQFGTGLTPRDLRTLSGWLVNRAAWAVSRLAPMAADLSSYSAWDDARSQLGLPRAASACPVANEVARLRGAGRPRACESVLDAVLGSWVLEPPRELLPHQVILGPGTPRPAHPLAAPPGLAEFVGAAPAGAVLVAFGTSRQFLPWLAAEDYAALAGAFASLRPVRVVWALAAKGLPAGVRAEDLPVGDNTIVVPWVEYNDVLGHPNVRAFVTHCGLHSVYEAAYHGKPVVGLPFMFEQAESCSKLADRGAGLLSRQAPAFRDLGAGGGATPRYTAEAVAALISQVLDDPSYAAAARDMGEALRMYAVRRHPYERAADEVELAVLSHLSRRGRAARQHPPATATAAAAADAEAKKGQGTEKQRSEEL